MTRSTMRLICATLLAFAVALGMSPGVASAETVQRAQSAAPADAPSAACVSAHETFLGSVTTYVVKNKEVRFDNKRVQRLTQKLVKAKKAKRVRQLERQLAATRKTLTRHRGQEATAKQRAIADYLAWQDCEDAAPTNPIQELCDAGLPQAVCDLFAGLPIPQPGTASPIQGLCDLGLPQALCDAATLPGVGGDSPLQPLCDAGLPDIFCSPLELPDLPDLPGLPLPGVPDPTEPNPLDPLCAIIPIPGLCP